jgi:FkbM family methyltransferase
MTQTYPQILLKNPLTARALYHLNAWRRYTATRTICSGRDVSLEKLGSPCAWIVPISLVRADWIVYSGGVGEDITFEIELMRRSGCHVYAFDRTPRAIAHVKRVAAHLPGFHFSAVGLWSQSTTLRFWAPRNPAHVSHSALNLQGSARYFDARCESLECLMKERGHDRIDLLKLDIEGAEYEVITSILAKHIAVGVLCVEFDQPVPWRRTQELLRQLLAAGYALLRVDHWNFTFMHESFLQSLAKPVE